MKALAWFLGLIVAGLAAIALFAYPAWLLVTPTLDVPFHRVANRIGMLALLIGFILVARRLGLADRTSLGYGLQRPAFVAETGIGILLGVATMLPAIALLFAFGLRELKPLPPPGAFAAVVLAGLGSGLVVALIEETFLRGAMCTGIARQSGWRTAILATALIYAATHFIGRYKIPAVVREISQRRPGHPWEGLVSGYDGVIGWLVLAWIPVIGWALARFYARRERGRSVGLAADQRRQAR